MVLWGLGDGGIALSQAIGLVTCILLSQSQHPLKAAQGEKSLDKNLEPHPFTSTDGFMTLALLAFTRTQKVPSADVTRRMM